MIEFAGEFLVLLKFLMINFMINFFCEEIFFADKFAFLEGVFKFL